MKSVILFICFLFSCSCIFAEEYLLEGMIGNYPVVLRLTVDEGKAAATYFYKSRTDDIELNGDFLNKTVRLSTVDSSESMTLIYGSNNEWAGKWVNNEGNTLFILLMPANLNTVTHPFARLPCVKEFKKNEPYEYLRSACLKLQNDKAIRQEGSYKIQGYHLKNSDLQAVRILGSEGKVAAGRINTVLLDNFISDICYSKACISEDTQKSYGYSFSYYIKGNVLSAYVALSLSCKGAMRMGYSDRTFNYDLKTGKKLNIDDMLHFPGIKDDNEQRGNKIQALLTRLYPTKMVNADYCDYTDTIAWQQTDWRLTEHGLLLMPYFVRADLPCWDPDWPVISFDLLKKYRNPNKKVLLP